MFARRTTVGVVALALMLAASALSEAPSTAETLPRPNFVFVFTDDQRWDTIGRCLNGFDGLDLAAGSASCMPNVQEDLLANGHTFLRGYATTAVCCPSRASALTGLYSRHTGVTKNSSYPGSTRAPPWPHGSRAPGTGRVSSAST